MRIGSLGAKSAQDPQTYYLENETAPPLRNNDLVKLRCHYDTRSWTRSSFVPFHASEDNGEMCNQYVMGSLSMSCKADPSCLDSGKLFVRDSLGGASGQVLAVAQDRTGAGSVLGQVTGVALAPDEKGTLWAFHRAGKDWSNKDTIAGSTIIGSLSSVSDILSGAGRQVATKLGSAQFVVPHGLAVDSAGRLWVTDVELHQVIQLDPSTGRRLLVLGEARRPGLDAKHFNKPTGVAFSPGGKLLYVADGYGNSRIAVFSLPNGEFLGQWGSRGTGPGQFDTPHSLAVDSAGRVYVADRNNARVQVFAPFHTSSRTAGGLLSIWPGEGLRPWTSLSGSEMQAAVGAGGKPWLHHVSAVSYDPVLDVLFVVEGGRIVVRDLRGSALQSFGESLSWPHDVVSYTDLEKGVSVAWVAELTGQKVRQFVIH
ncbi:unnamed protein product [Polarella glacialis]|uniref:Peptidylamidoglycolate lyase n=1 Tax=Polarella glacialis TaxID=89957 RepID=A0A813FFK5_POLGL|nr:unnamed protein product [Polarella glacialis]